MERTSENKPTGSWRLVEAITCNQEDTLENVRTRSRELLVGSSHLFGCRSHRTITVSVGSNLPSPGRHSVNARLRLFFQRCCSQHPHLRGLPQTKLCARIVGRKTEEVHRLPAGAQSPMHPLARLPPFGRRFPGSKPPGGCPPSAGHPPQESTVSLCSLRG